MSRGQLVKIRPRVRPGGRSTDSDDYPAGRAELALRDTVTLTEGGRAGPAVGVYAERLLDVPLPWTRLCTVYRLLDLVRSYGTQAVQAACARALELDAVDIAKIAPDARAGPGEPAGRGTGQGRRRAGPLRPRRRRVPGVGNQ